MDGFNGGFGKEGGLVDLFGLGLEGIRVSVSFFPSFGELLFSLFVIVIACPFLLFRAVVIECLK